MLLALMDKIYKIMVDG